MDDYRPEVKKYRAAFMVRPTPDHPQYWKMQFGHLNVILPGQSADHALLRAQMMVRLLPFEIVADVGTVIEYHPLPCPLEEAYFDTNSFDTLGVLFRFIFVPIGEIECEARCEKMVRQRILDGGNAGGSQEI